MGVIKWEIRIYVFTSKMNYKFRIENYAYQGIETVFVKFNNSEYWFLTIWVIRKKIIAIVTMSESAYICKKNAQSFYWHFIKMLNIVHFFGK